MGIGCNLTGFSFSASSLTREHLEQLLDNSAHKSSIVPLDTELAEYMLLHPEAGFEISQFESAQDFCKRGFGFAMKNGENIVGAAYTVLVCSKGMEVSKYVTERQRQRGIATALASSLLLESLNRGLEPHWDAANGESVKLAKKLGFTFTGTYDAYYIVE